MPTPGRTLRSAASETSTAPTTRLAIQNADPGREGDPVDEGRVAVRAQVGGQQHRHARPEHDATERGASPYVGGWGSRRQHVSSAHGRRGAPLVEEGRSPAGPRPRRSRRRRSPATAGRGGTKSRHETRPRWSRRDEAPACSVGRGGTKSRHETPRWSRRDEVPSRDPRPRWSRRDEVPSRDPAPRWSRRDEVPSREPRAPLVEEGRSPVTRPRRVWPVPSTSATLEA